MKGGRASRGDLAMKNNPYLVLGIAKNATDRQIKHAYLKLAKELHPDVSGKGREEEFIKVSEAYKLLSNKISRKDFDMGRYANSSSGNEPTSAGKESDFYWTTTTTNAGSPHRQPSEYDIRYARYRATGEGENEKRYPTWQILGGIAGITLAFGLGSTAFFKIRHEKLLMDIETMHAKASFMEMEAKANAKKASEIVITKEQ